MRQLIAYGMSALVIAIVAYAFAPRNPASMAATTLHVDRVQINDMVAIEHKLVAVGERGTILLSSDNALSWLPASVSPQRDITLTGVAALGSGVMLAVGHDGWLLRSEDGGNSWTEVAHDEEQGEPLLGVWSVDGQRAFAFGSFGKYYESADAGLTWNAREVNPDGYHLNGMDGGSDGRQMLVGEQGLVMRSLDGGEHWETLPSFYSGSFFGVARLSATRWVVYGMRGNVFVTDDFGQQWQHLKLEHGNPLYGHVRLPEGQGLVLVGADSTLVRLDEQGQLIESTRRKGLGTLTSVAAPSARLVLVGGEHGVSQGDQSRLAVSK
ncbi:WD40/YVTN/BNR-like repeat-containing protein [Pseudomonas sp. 5P_3.1_Bac2]|uniref:WD40/YVTN/BNR-like repeat-containing protein n=1 Tax=Pseudomonas sp. 5P_3.1_Bac2 TaxID=2971617 RepID=UPI0021C7468C|nr:YCF48-related protein [Pseudomonas sp. 5P_3.1_Bac2]MCU1717553.1 YCF48-related protein [Pseudomonas sp. 5P_3.1_Bac2]